MLLVACRPSASVGDAGATAASSAAPVANSSGAPHTSASARVLPKPALCRAASVAGAPKVVPLPGVHLDAGGEGPVTESSEIPDETWIELAAADKLTARHPHTTREVTFTGPGRVRTCVAHLEEAWVARGTFESVATSAERPGGEQWVVTPVGVVRYGAAKLEVHVSEGAAGAKADVKVSTGVAFAWTGDQAGAVKPTLPAAPAAASAPVNEGWVRLQQGQTITLSLAKPDKPLELASAALDRCILDARAAREIAAAVAAPDAALAQIAPRHVAARHVARAACGVAGLRIEALEPSTVRDALVAKFKDADSEWRSGRPGMHGRLH